MASRNALKLLGENAVASVMKSVGMIGDDVAGYGATHAPKKTGWLRSNINRDPEVQQAIQSGSKTISTTVHAATPYAEAQHDNVTWVHKDGEALYFTKPAKEKRERYQQLIGNNLALALQQSREH